MHFVSAQSISSQEQEFWGYLDLNSGLDFPTYYLFHFWPFTLLFVFHFPPPQNEGDNRVYLQACIGLNDILHITPLAKCVAQSFQEINCYQNNMYKSFSAESTCILDQQSKHTLLIVQCLLITNYVNCMGRDTIRKRAQVVSVICFSLAYGLLSNNKKQI